MSCWCLDYIDHVQALIKYLFTEKRLVSNSTEMPVVLTLDPLKH